jgi:hypothetical protein
MRKSKPIQKIVLQKKTAEKKKTFGGVKTAFFTIKTSYRVFFFSRQRPAEIYFFSLGSVYFSNVVCL